MHPFITSFFSFFTDVVRAYKGLLKEKEALEASLSALTPTAVPEDNPEDAKSVESLGLQSNDEEQSQSANDAKVLFFIYIYIFV